MLPRFSFVFQIKFCVVDSTDLTDRITSNWWYARTVKKRARARFISLFILCYPLKGNSWQNETFHVQIV